jgi:molybdopterin synthase catalytic subunit
MVRVAVQQADFDLSEEVATLRQGRLDVGAVVSFVGTVRQWVPAANASAVLELEHYPGMTERVLTEEAHSALSRFEVQGIRIIHRVGVLSLGEQIVLVAVVAMHRQAAFACCEYLMDWLKTQAPFWKKERQGGVDHWVAAREQDDAALARWQGAAGDGP